MNSISEKLIKIAKEIKNRVAKFEVSTFDFVGTTDSDRKLFSTIEEAREEVKRRLGVDDLEKCKIPSNYTTLEIYCKNAQNKNKGVRIQQLFQ